MLQRSILLLVCNSDYL